MTEPQTRFVAGYEVGDRILLERSLTITERFCRWLRNPWYWPPKVARFDGVVANYSSPVTLEINADHIPRIRQDT